MFSQIRFETWNKDARTKLFHHSIRRLPLINRKALILATLLIGALVAPLSAPLRGAGLPPKDPGERPADTFVILLSGPYKPVPVEPVVDCRNLGLLQVNLCDGSYSTTKIFPVSGLPKEDSDNRGKRSGDGGRDTERIGTFYVQFADIHAAYDLPGGALTMVFTTNGLVPVPDGQGGTYFVGTVELDITEATGIYKSFVGGHNHMVDILHHLADGTFVEHCFCIISRPGQPAAIKPHAV
jgi:hypothetical protein